METKVEQLDGGRVRLTVEVPAHDVAHAVSHATHDLAESVKIPGFRKGKVPMPVLVSKIGKDRIYSEAVDSHLTSWFWSAANRARVRPAVFPNFDFDLPVNDTDDWSFTAEFAVQELPTPADWSALEVPKFDAKVPDSIVSTNLEVLQRGYAELSPAEGRMAAFGDVAVVDIVAPEGAAQRGLVVELGSDRLIEEIENGIRDLTVGESHDVTYELSDGSKRLATITLTALYEKVLPPLDDDFAKTVSEFDSFDALKGDIVEKLQAELDGEIEDRFRAASIDALVRASDVEASPLVVDVRFRDLWKNSLQSIQSRGIDPGQYLSLSGVTPEELERRLRAEATISVGRELLIEAVADKLGIAVSEEDLRAELKEQGESDEDIEDFIANRDSSAAREHLRFRRAVERIASEVKPIAPELAEARESIWTPEKEQEQKGAETKLWTPGS